MNTTRLNTESNSPKTKVNNAMEDRMKKMIRWSPILFRRSIPILIAFLTLAGVWRLEAASTPTTTTVTSSANPVVYGNTVSFTATVVGGGGTPTGTVQFKTNGVNLGTAVPLNGAGQATSQVISSQTLGVGNVAVTAAYSGDVINDPSTGTLAGGQVVSKRTLTATATGLNKQYNANTVGAATLSSDALLGDTITLSYTAATFEDKNVGNGKLLNVTGITMGGASAGNYTLASTTTTTAGNITPPPNLKYVANAASTTYPGTNYPAFSGTVTGFIAPDDINNSTTGTLTFTTPTTATNAGSYPINGSGLTAINYGFDQDSANATKFTITKRTVTPIIGVGDKAYDATTAATITSRALTGVFTNADGVVDDVNLGTSGTAVFADVNARVGKTVNITGLSLTGAKSGNYQLSSTTASSTADVTPVPLTLATADQKTRIYGAANPTLTPLHDTGAKWAARAVTVNSGNERITLNGHGLVTGNRVVFSATSMPGGLANNVAYYVRDVVDVNNFTVSDVSGTGTVKDITSNGSGVIIDAWVVNPPFWPTGFQGTDNNITAVNGVMIREGMNTQVDVNSAINIAWSTPAINTTDVGDWPINLTPPAYKTANITNYYFVYPSGNATAFHITPATVVPTVIVADKPYDQNTTATILGRSLTGRLFTDDVNLGSSGQANFSSANAGTWTVNITGLSLSGAESGNYQLSSASTTDTATILPAPLTATVTGISKIYDGNTTAAVTNFVFTGYLGSDTNTSYTYVADFDNKNVGTNKTVTVTSVTLSGGQSANYAVTVPVTTTATITGIPVNVGAVGVNKQYDGTTNATVTLTSDAPPSDVTNGLLTISYTQASFADPNIGNNKPVTVRGISIGGPAAVNYSLANTSANTTANITTRPVTITVDAKTKCVGVTSDPPLTYQITSGSFLSGDGLGGALTRAAGETAGTYLISQGTVAVTNNAGNYNLGYVSNYLTIAALPTADITGTNSMPQFAVRTFAGTPGMAGYSWSVAGNGAITGPANQSNVTVTAGANCNSNIIITLTVTSAVGCTGTTNKTVTVPDTTAPTIAFLPDMTVECSSNVNTGTPISADTCVGGSVTLTTVDSAAVEASTNNAAGWVFYTQNTAFAAFVEGTAGAPLATGSAELYTGEGYAVAQMDTTNHDGTSLGSLTELNYRVRRSSGNFHSIYILLTVSNGVDSFPDYLTFEPEYQNGANPSLPLQGAIVNGVWQRWDALRGGWYSANHSEIMSPGAVGGGNVGVQPLARYLAVYPNTKIISASQGGVLLGAGNGFSTWDDFDAFVDGLVVGVNGTSVAYNFEKIPGLDVSTKITQLTIRTWTATDSSGNRVSSSHFITTRDTLPPALENVPANASADCDNLPATPGSVTATDGCGGARPVTVSTNSTQDPNPANFGHYSYTITKTWTAADAFGNTTSASQVITVSDSTPPTLTGPSTTLTNDCGSVPSFVPPTIHDNCTPPANVLLINFDTPTNGPCPGTYTVVRTWQAYDVSGNASLPFTQTIVVEDKTPPTLIGVPADQTVECNAVPPAPAVTATDSCNPNPTLTFTETSTYDAAVTNAAHYNYTITRTWTAVDACGNTSTATRLVHVQDTTLPVLSGQGPTLTNNCPMNPASLVFTAPTATDICSPANLLTWTTNTGPVVPGPNGSWSVTRTWRAKDVVGNESLPATQTIWVVDKTKPTVNCPANMTVACQGSSGTVVTFVVSATDSCDPSPVVTSTPASGSLFQVGVTTVTSTATDASGNVSDACTFTVTVTDSSAPVMLIADKTIQCGDSTSPTNTGIPSVIDGCGNTVTLNTNAWSTSNTNGYKDSTPIEVTSGNPQGWSFLVGGTGAGFFTTANGSPLLIGSAALNVTNGGFAALQGSSWNGLLLKNLTELRYSTFRAARASDESVVLILYVDTDGDGNYDDILNFEPRFQNGVNGTPNQGAVGNSFWQEWDAQLGAWWSFFHPEIASAGPGAKSLAVYTTAYPNARIVNPGSGSGLRLQAGISTGNWLNFVGQVDGFKIGINGATTTYDFEQTAGLNCGAPGYAKQMIIRTWTAVDGTGNRGSHSQIIVVQDQVAPAITSPAVRTNDLAGCGTSAISGLPFSTNSATITLAQLQAAGYTAVDACSAVTLSYIDSASGTCPIIVTRTFTATDECGNTTNMPTFTYRINDTVAPVVSITATMLLEGCDTGALALTFGTNLHYSEVTNYVTAADFAVAGGVNTESCGLPLVAYIDSKTGNLCLTTVTRKWTLADYCGNTTTTNQVINISDSTAPVVIAPPNQIIEGCDTTYITGLPYSETLSNITASAFTNVGGSFVHACGFQSVTYKDSKSGTCPIVVTRTFVMTDFCGFAGTNSQTIRIQDTTAPTIAITGTILSNYTTRAAAEAAAIAAVTVTSENCGTAVKTASTVPNGCIATISVKATDGCGNSSTNAVFTTSLDDVAPVITKPADITVNTAAGQCSSASLDPGTATAVDACGTVSSLVGTRRNEGSLIGTYPKGTNYIDWVATDNSGNKGTNTQLVIVVDNEGPTFPLVSSGPGAVSWWKADGNATDSITASANHGTNQGATFTTGRYGQAFNLNGTTQYVTTPVNGMALGTGDFSVAGWVKTTSVNDTNTTYTTNGSVITTNITVIIKTNMIVSFGINNPGIFIKSTGALQFGGPIAHGEATAGNFNDGQWHHFAVVRGAGASGVVKYYKDGQPANTDGTLDTTAINPSVFNIGGDGVAGYYFNGQIDDITLYNRALSDYEVQRLVNDNGCPADIVVNNNTGTCANTNVTFIFTPEGIDNCPGATTVQIAGIPSGGSFPVGTTLNTFEVTDAAGNKAQCSFSVTVRDVDPPTFALTPTNITVVTGAGASTCGTNVTYVEPVGADNCGGAATALIAGLHSGAFFPGGKTTNIFEVTDLAGNKGRWTNVVWVQDNTVPVITSVPADVVVNTGPGRATCDAPATWTPPTASDNCAIDHWTSSKNPGDTFPVGQTTVTYTAFDAAGNSASCTFKVTVVDNTPPVISNCPTNRTVPIDFEGSNCVATVTWTPPNASDNCVVTSFTSTKAPGSVFPQGVNTVTYTARDAAGNTSTCSFTVTVVHTTPPLITGCPGNIVTNLPPNATNCGVVVSWTPPTAFDSCSGTNVTWTSSAQPGDSFPVGVTTVTYTARDTDLNASVCSFTVTVLNPTGPTFVNFPPDVSVQCAGDAVPPVATNVMGTNICGGGGAVTVTYQGAVTQVVSAFETTITRTWQAVDQANITNTLAQVITIADTIPPTVAAGTIPTCSVSQGAAETAALAATTASDNCTATSNLVLTATTTPSSNCMLIIKVTARDARGNVTPDAQAAVYTTKVDLAPPVISGVTATQMVNAVAMNVKDCSTTAIPGDVIITVAATDNCSFAGGAPSITLINTNALATNIESATFVSEAAGVFTYKWTVTSATANGTWNAVVTASDSCQSTTTNLSVCVNNSEITGLVELEGFVGTAVNHSRVVTFVATAGTNFLKSWTVTLTNVSGSTFAYALPGIPPTANGLSAKTAWNLRSKVPVTLNANSQASGVNFTGAKRLRGGDYNNDNGVGNADYSILGANWDTTNSVADVDGNGFVAFYDYFVLYLNWFTSGDAE